MVMMVLVINTGVAGLSGEWVNSVCSCSGMSVKFLDGADGVIEYR